jgi:hypothetical protein
MTAPRRPDLSARESTSDDSPADVSAFMLAEYQRHLDGFWRSEELGERRLNFFLTIVTAVLGAIALAIDADVLLAGRIDPLIFYALTAILLLGLLTLARVVRRNLTSSAELRAAGRLRRYFVDRDPAISRYLYYKAYDDRPVRAREWRQLLSLGTGGYVETIALINAFVVATIALLAAIAMGVPPSLRGLSALAAAALAWITQFWYVKRRYDRERPPTGSFEFPTPHDS